MDPEPVPCVDRPGGEPVPTSVGAVHDLGGTCMATHSGDRCQALALGAATQLGLGFDEVVAIDVVPNPSPDGIDFAHRTFLEVTLQGGDRKSVIIGCPGVSGAYVMECMAEPVVPLGYPGGAEGGGGYGYTDIPENATPFPARDPAAVAAAKALEIDRLDVSVTALGEQTLALGRATLPNGYLTMASFGMADPWPSDVLFGSGIQLEVTPVAGGAPLRNLYEHGWLPGVEEVDVTLTFDVAWFKPGAAFTVTDVVVR